MAQIEGKHNNVPKPGVELRPAGTEAPAANLNVNQPVVEILAKMTPPLMKRERGVMTPRRPPTIRPHRPLVLRKSNPRRPAADSPLQLLSLHHGEGGADRGVKWFVWGGWCS